MNKTLRLAAALATSFVAAGASAQSTWDVRNTGSGADCAEAAGGNAGSYGNTWNCTANSGGNAGSSAVLSAWSNDRGTDTWTRATTHGGSTTASCSPATACTTVYRPRAGGNYDYTTYRNSDDATVHTGTNVTKPTTGILPVLQEQAAPSAAGTWFANAYLSSQGSSGTGAASRFEGTPNITSPSHAFDSFSPGTADMLLISFNTAVILDQFQMGWVGSDSDITIMRWTGNSAPTRADSATKPTVCADWTGSAATSTCDNNLSGTVATGAWELIGHFGNVGTSLRNISAQSSDQPSSWFLISSYNSTLFGSGTCHELSSGGCGEGNDAFKLNYLKTTNYTCPGGGTLGPGGSCTPSGGSAPTPGSLALLAAAGLAGWQLRRRQLAAR